jgi:hypothetical protein
MKLYHGTAERRLPTILSQGLQPRGRRRGNWQHSILSSPDAVYLTQAYALYYAWQATDTKDKADRLAVLEIDTDKLDPDLFAPDEDWLEQVSRKQNGPGVAPIDKPMRYRTKWYRQRLMNYAPHWQDSLAGLGNATYHGTIPASAITRIAFVDQKTNADLVMSAGMDPTISLMNYHFVGGRYRAAMKRLFGETVEEEDDFARIFTPDQQAERKAMLDGIWAKVEVRELA